MQRKVIPGNSSIANYDEVIPLPKPEKPLWKKILRFFGVLLLALFKMALFFVRHIAFSILLALRKPVHMVFGILGSPILCLIFLVMSIWMEPDAKHAAWIASAVLFFGCFGIMTLYEFILKMLAPEDVSLEQ